MFRDQFKTKEERDANIKRELRQLIRQIGETEDQIVDVEKTIEQEKEEEEQLNLQVQVCSLFLHKKVNLF